MYEFMTFNARQQYLENDTWKFRERRMAADPEHSAVLICDMWNDHWCRGAAVRVDEMAPALDRFVRFMRSSGFLIMHCPSNTMPFYKDHPARKRVLEAPEAPADPPLRDWFYLDESLEAPLPFDDSDGGCDCGNHCTYSRPYNRQNDRIYIDPDRDVIADDRKVYDYFKYRDIETVFYCGVHANICVPGRPFGIRQMKTQGMECILVRDMIDVMYNHEMPPYMNHFDAVDAMASHLERYWCSATVTTADIMGGFAFRFKEDYRLF